MDSDLSLMFVLLTAALIVSGVMLVCACYLLRRLFRHLATQVSGATGERSQETAGAPAENRFWWWILPLAGLVLGSLAAAALTHKGNRSDMALNSEEARERLATVYNPLLMSVNSLPLGARQDGDDVTELRRIYEAELRPVLYAHGHLVSDALLRAAAAVDRAVAENDSERFLAALRRLSRQVQADHGALREQAAGCRTSG